MKISEINPYIRYARIHKRLYSNKHYSICYDCRIFYIQNGQGIIRVNDTDLDVTNDTILYFPFGTKYKFLFDTPPEEIKIIVIDFDMVNIFSEKSNSFGTASEINFDINKLSVTELPKEFLNIISRKAPQLESPLLQCISEFIDEKYLYKETSSSIIKYCLLALLREHTYTSNSILVDNIIKYINANYHRATLQNTEIAEKFGYHQYYLSSLLKETTGYSLRSYIIRHRIQMAKNYLLTTKKDITEIAWRCGFNSVPLFIKTFKEHTGFTPKTYRIESFNVDL